MKRKWLPVFIAGIALLLVMPLVSCSTASSPAPEPEPTPAKFVASNLQVAEPEGDENNYIITVDVENVGGTKGIYTLIPSIDGKEEENGIVEVELNPGEKKTIILEYLQTAMKVGASIYQLDGTGGKEHTISVDGLSQTITFPEPKEAEIEKQWEIVSISAKVTEKNSVWWKNSWILVIRNDSSSNLSFDATIEFLDADGFIVDDDREYDLRVDAGEQETFTGYALIDASVAPNVEQVHAEVQQR